MPVKRIRFDLIVPYKEGEFAAGKVARLLKQHAFHVEAGMCGRGNPEKGFKRHLGGSVMWKVRKDGVDPKAKVLSDMLHMALDLHTGVAIQLDCYDEGEEG